MSINLWGMVKQPGRYEVPISTDMVQLLSYAGGPMREADLAGVRVTRVERREDSFRKVEFVIDLSKLQRLDAQALSLRPGDTIFIDAKFSTGDFFNILTTVAVLVTAIASAIAIAHY
jgi:protein involved in polysaccharide export with SLBB domain